MIDVKNLKGLSNAQVEENRAKYGENILTPPPRPSIWSLLIEKFNDPLIKILLVALLLSVGISCYEFFWMGYSASIFLEPIGILIAVILATVVGFAVEMNANKKFELLNQVNDDIPVKVMRDGNVTSIKRRDVVVGDIVMLDTGEEIPADGILLDSISMSVNESTLTGEPIISKTHIEKDFKKDVTYPSNKVLRGTTITEGHGIMMVEAIGDATEYGKVYVEAQMINDVKTPLTQQFDKLGKVIAYGSYIVASIIVIGRLLIYDYNGFGAAFDPTNFVGYVMTTIMLAVTLIVVSVPEGLPMSVTLSLALSMRRMLATNNLVRKMHACETMGATNVICTDKTGTLTQNQMRVYEARFFGMNDNSLGDNDNDRLIVNGLSCNSTAYLDRSNPDKTVALGNPTEGALLLWLDANGYDYFAVRESAEIVQQLPFSTERKYMATIVKDSVIGKNVLFVKGAPEIVYSLCKQTTNDISLEDIRSTLADYQSKAMRTLGFAYQVLNDGDVAISDAKVVADNLTFSGVVAISDPVREEVPAAIADCMSAGIEVKIVTGDTPGTAKEIGRQIGLWTESDSDDNHISGPDFAALSDDEATQRAKALKVMSRARP